MINVMKFGTALPKSYISIKVSTNPSNIEENMSFVVTPTGITVNAIVLKFLSGTNLTLKVDHCDEFAEL